MKGEHVSVEKLVDFQEGDLEAAAAREVEQHLLACPACAAEVRELERFDEEIPPEEWMTDEEIAAAWKRFVAVKLSGEGRLT